MLTTIPWKWQCASNGWIFRILHIGSLPINRLQTDMIKKLFQIPCKHVFCLWCARSEDRVCARCGERVARVEQTGLGTVFMCNYTINKAVCKRTYLSQRDLQVRLGTVSFSILYGDITIKFTLNFGPKRSSELSFASSYFLTVNYCEYPIAVLAFNFAAPQFILLLFCIPTFYFMHSFDYCWITQSNWGNFCFTLYQKSELWDFTSIYEFISLLHGTNMKHHLITKNKSHVWSRAAII